MAFKEFVQNDNDLAITYYRYSSTAQRDESIEQQREAAHRYAEAHGLKIIKEYEDHAMTGTNDDRPGLQQLLHEINKIKPSTLIVWKTDRLGRDRYDLVSMKKKIRDAGCQIQYVAEAIPDDSPESAIIEAIYEAMSENYSRNLRANVLRGLTYNAEHCLYSGCTLLGYTGKPGEPYQIDDATAPIVERIFEEYAKGRPATEIRDELNNAGHKTSRGNLFTVNSLRNILVNRAYVGEYHWGNVVTPGGMPRIISDELFAQVQARLQKNKRTGKARAMQLALGDEAEDFWLSGYVFCGLCGSTVHGYSGTSHTGKVYHYYACHQKTIRKCKKKYVSKDAIEAIVEHTMRETLEDPIQIGSISLLCARMIELQNADTSYLESLRAKQKETEKKLANILKAVESGTYSETLLQRLSELEEQKKMTAEAIEAEEARQRVKQISMWDISTVLSQYSADKMQSPKLRDALFRVLVDKIVLYEDRIDIVVNLGYNTITRTMPIDGLQDKVDEAEDFFFLMDSSFASAFAPSNPQEANPCAPYTLGKIKLCVVDGYLVISRALHM